MHQPGAIRCVPQAPPPRPSSACSAATEVADLLQLCDPPVRFEEVRELGAAIEVQFVYDCKVRPAWCEENYCSVRFSDVLRLQGFCLVLVPRVSEIREKGDRPRMPRVPCRPPVMVGVVAE